MFTPFPNPLNDENLKFKLREARLDRLVSLEQALKRGVGRIDVPRPYPSFLFLFFRVCVGHSLH